MVGWVQEALLSVFFSVVGLVFFWASFDIVSFMGGVTGAQNFPKMLGAVLMLLGIVNFVKVVSKKAEDNMKFRSNMTVLFGVLLCAAYIYLIPKAGYFYITPIFAVLLLLLLGYRNPVRVLCVALGFTLFAYALFYKLLSVALHV